MRAKKIVTIMLSVMMVMAMAVTGMAGSDSSIGEFTPSANAKAYFDAYCGYSSGDASTSVYGDANTTWASVDVSMTMYVIDKYYYEHMTLEQCERFMVYYDSTSDSSSDYYNSMAIIDVDTTGATWVSGDVTYHGFKVESSHEAVTNLNNSNPVRDSLRAYY